MKHIDFSLANTISQLFQLYLEQPNFIKNIKFSFANTLFIAVLDIYNESEYYEKILVL